MNETKDHEQKQMMTYQQLCKEKYIEVYSTQKPRVIERLAKGITYVPLWIESAACDPSLGEHKRLAHKHAYLWKLDQFEKRLRRRPKDGDWLFWVWFTEGNADLAKKNEGECKVKLCVPVREILISLHDKWNKYVLWSFRKLKNKDEWVPPEIIRAKAYSDDSLEDIELSWECIFNISDNNLLSNLQGVVDRVEPGWVKEIIPFSKC